MLPKEGEERQGIAPALAEKKRSELGEEFAKLHRLLQETDKSMLVIVDGWESSGKGYLLKDLTRGLDPKFYRLALFEAAYANEACFPYLRRFLQETPKRGQITFFDRSFYYDLFHQRDWDPEILDRRLADIAFLEQALHDDNTLVVKFFLDQSEKEMRKRMAKLVRKAAGAVLLTQEDQDQVKHYAAYRKHFDAILERTHSKHTPWHILHVQGKKNQSRAALDLCIQSLANWLAADLTRPLPQLRDLSEQPKPLDQVDLSLSLSKEEYKKQKKALQEEAGELLYQAYQEDKGVIVAFEGQDAAGKGGAIKRLTRRMDPRGYDVSTTAAPNAEENSRHYLWRFYRDFPARGRMTLFDRSWYGRVLVEPIEGFTPLYRCREAYGEICQMEKHLRRQGFLLVKYLLVIDKDEQYTRFKDRERIADKQYKITEEDWRNRAKFDDYVDAMNEMVLRTSTEEAPWVLVPGNDKRYARIAVLKDFIKRLRAFLTE